MNGWRPERAKKLIEQHGRTRKWVADQCGVELKTFNHYLSGVRQPSMPVLILMAQTLKTTVEDLWPGCRVAKFENHKTRELEAQVAG